MARALQENEDLKDERREDHQLMAGLQTENKKLREQLNHLARQARILKARLDEPVERAFNENYSHRAGF